MRIHNEQRLAGLLALRQAKAGRQHCIMHQLSMKE
jgi:hypothetical protein